MHRQCQGRVNGLVLLLLWFYDRLQRRWQPVGMRLRYCGLVVLLALVRLLLLLLLLCGVRTIVGRI